MSDAESTTTMQIAKLKLDAEVQSPSVLSVRLKTLSGYLPVVELHADATVSELAERVIDLDPTTYATHRPVLMWQRERGNFEVLEDDSQKLTSCMNGETNNMELELQVINFERDLTGIQFSKNLRAALRAGDTGAAVELLQNDGRHQTKLHFNNFSLSPTVCQNIIPAFASLKTVTHLNLNWTRKPHDECDMYLLPMLSFFTSLTFLDLSGNRLCNRSDHQKKLIPALMEMKSLKYLDLSRNLFCLKKGLVRACSKMSALSHLDLSRNIIGRQFSDYGSSQDSIAGKCRKLIQGWPKLVSLTFLSLELNNIEFEACRVLIQVFSKLRNLAILRLNGNGSYYDDLTSSEAWALTLSELASTSLTHLDLGNHCIRPRVCRTLGRSLSQLALLKFLSLDHNLMGRVGLCELARFLPQMILLEHLNLSYNPTGRFSCRVLSNAISRMESLQHLNLEGNQIGNHGCLIWSTALSKMVSLTHLNLSYNMIGDEGCLTLMEPFSKLTLLTHLDMSRNPIKNSTMILALNETASLAFLKTSCMTDMRRNMWTKQSYRESFFSVPILSSLVHLDLSRNHIDVVALATVLPNLTLLQQLKLQHNGIRFRKCHVLAPALSKLVSLTYLDLSCNWFENKGCRKLCPAFSKLVSLTYLDIGSNKLRDAACSDLAAALAPLTSLKQFWMSRNHTTEVGCRMLAPLVLSLDSLTSWDLGHSIRKRFSRLTEITCESCKKLKAAKGI